MQTYGLRRLMISYEVIRPILESPKAKEFGISRIRLVKFHHTLIHAVGKGCNYATTVFEIKGPCEGRSQIRYYMNFYRIVE